MKRIFKYATPVTDHFDVWMPKGAEVLTVQVQDGTPCVWALVDQDAPSEARHFHLPETGQLIRPALGVYVGTYQLEGGGQVNHLFVEPSFG